MKTTLITRYAYLAMACALAGCSTFGEGIVIPGKSTPQEVEASLGRPTQRIDLASGSTNFYYSMQPFGRETYAVRFSRDRVATAIEPLMTAENFARLRVGDTTAQATRELLGPPYGLERLARQSRDSWEYWTRLDAVPTRVWLQFSDDAILREVVKWDESPPLSACGTPGC